MTDTVQPTRFDVLLGTVKAASDEGVSRITCTASSDSVDLGVDRFALSALKQMGDSFPGMTIFLNHKYTVPEDVFGVVTSAVIVPRDGHNDLDLEIAVDANNPRAQTVYHQIANGAKLGVSVGVLVEEAEMSTEVVDGKKTKVCNIMSVKTLEASIVGIPANRRSWVQGALKAASLYFDGDQRAVLEKLADSMVSIGGTIMEPEDEISDAPVVTLPSLAEDEFGPLVVTNEDEEVVELEDESEPDDETTPDEDDEDETPSEDEETETTPDEAPSEPDAELEEPTVPSFLVPEPAISDDTEDEDGDTPPEHVSHLDYMNTVNKLRGKLAEPDRDWFVIKKVKPEEPTAEEPEPKTVAEVMIYDAIGDGYGSKDFIDQLASLNVDRINLRLNSPGGVIDDGIAIRNALMRHPADVYTYVDGIAASMASILALVGKEVTMEPESMLMIHDPWGCQMGNAADMELEARILNRYGNNLAGAYARKAGGTRDEWRAVMKEEGWYGPEDALAAGLIDRVGDGSVDNTLRSKTFDPDILKLFKNTPESAKKFFTASAVPDKAADASALVGLSAGVTSLTSALTKAQEENDTLRAEIAEQKEALREHETKWVDANVLIKDMVAEVEKILDSPMPRKITPEATFKKYADKYPWLDARILAQLARFNKEAD